MRVAFKFVLTVVLVLILIRTAEGILTVKRETGRLDAAIQRDARLLGRILRASVRHAWQADGRDSALNLIDAMNVGDHPIRLSWAPLKGEAGLSSRLAGDLLEQLTDGDTVGLRQCHEVKGDIQFFFIPIDIPEAQGAIQVTERLEDRSRYIRHALFREGLVGSIVVLASATTVILLGTFIIGRPLSQLREHVKAIGEGGLSDRLLLKGKDELSTLAYGLNEMCEKLSASRERERAEVEKRIAAMRQVRHMDRLTTIGRLASGIAHELGTPLNVISGRAGMISDGTIPVGSKEVQSNAEIVKSQADRMTEIIRHLLDFARQRPPKRVKADALEIVHQAAELVSCLGYSATVTISPVDETSYVAEMDPMQIQQVMTNLIENAVQAMPEGGEVFVSVASVHTEPPEGVDTPAGRFLEMVVEDHGIGIAEEHLPKVFDPFFTTKDVGQGTGLGLSITYGIIVEHGGWIDVMSEVGKGSRFAVYLPQETSI